MTIADHEGGRPANSCILTINGGSSSLKFALFDRDDPRARLLSGRVERIGMPEGRLVVDAADGGGREDRPVVAEKQRAALALVIDRIEAAVGLAAVAVIGHRIVHGGPRYHEPERITAGLIEELRRISGYDPDHLPGEIELIEAFQRRDPGRLQVACFDTAFHHDMPRVARIVPIPRRFEALGVRRYGFHGLSYEYLMEDLARVGGPEEAGGRVVLAHLGSGASLAAVRGGRPVDTTMGFTPASGLVMSTRAGDIDPGLVRFLAKAEGMSAGRFDDLVNHESGLLGVSETSPDVRDLLARRGDDVRAAEAVDLFCYRAKQEIGSMAAALGGLDTLVFAGGIGENAPEIRRMICEGLEFLGVALDGGRNADGAPIISADGAPARVRVIRTDEESMIARAAARLASQVADPGQIEPESRSRPMDTSLATKEATLAPELLRKMDAYWRAANYLAVGQIYLYDNPLLREPLKREHIKPRLLGHWGTTPGQNFLYVHLNRAINERDLNVIYIAGPGHGGPALVGNTYLEGTYSELYPKITQDEAGLKRLFTQFSFPGGIPSHVSPETPGSIHEGGRAGIQPQPRLRSGLRQPRPARRLRRRRRRGRDRPPGHRAGTATSSSTRRATARCCRSSTSTATRSPTPPCWPGSAATSWSSSCAATATSPTSSRGTTPSPMHRLMASTLDGSSTRSARIQAAARTRGRDRASSPGR